MKRGPAIWPSPLTPSLAGIHLPFRNDFEAAVFAQTVMHGQFLFECGEGFVE